MSTLEETLRDPRSSVRLQAVMAAGTRADESDLDVLVRRCADEPDFFVRDMLTWALTRLPAASVVPRLLVEVGSARPQARSQALHTISKIGDRSAWTAVMAHLADADDEVARAAWRAAVALVLDDHRSDLAMRLAGQLGRGDGATRLSLSRALVALGDNAVTEVLTHALDSRVDGVREHATAALRLLRDPDAGSDLAIESARREVALGHTRKANG